jgi:hypothetical protein
MSIVLQGSTSGSVTLQEPAVAGTTVLDLPAVSGTILTTASSGQSIPKAALPTGSVLQVATTTTDGLITTTNNGIPSTITNGVQVFSLSFTPISATSIILVQTSAITVSEVTNFADIPWLALWNGSTFVAASSGCANSDNYNGGRNVGTFSLNNSFSAGSTSTRTISVRAAMDNGSGTTYINGNVASNFSGSSARIQMTVWEIAA